MCLGIYVFPSKLISKPSFNLSGSKLLTQANFFDYQDSISLNPNSKTWSQYNQRDKHAFQKRRIYRKLYIQRTYTQNDTAHIHWVPDEDENAANHILMPTQSPELKLNIYGRHQSNVLRRHSPPPSSKHQLTKYLSEEWCLSSQYNYRDLCLETVRTASGSATTY